MPGKTFCVMEKKFFYFVFIRSLKALRYAGISLVAASGYCQYHDSVFFKFAEGEYRQRVRRFQRRDYAFCPRQFESCVEGLVVCYGHYFCPSRYGKVGVCRTHAGIVPVRRIWSTVRLLLPCCP